MPELLTLQDLANGHLDVKALGEAANGDENTIVTTRTGNTYPSAERAINTMFKNGGLPATPFATKALMTASALNDGKYAQVTDDTVNNGLFVKMAGAWVKSAYDPLAQATAYTDLQLSKSSGTFDTLALLTASTLADNAYALVANETDLTKNGHYKKIAGVWTKVKYDPVAIAATDATSKVNDLKTYSDASFISIGGFDVLGTNKTLKVNPNTSISTQYTDGVPRFLYSLGGTSTTTTVAIEPNTTYTVLTYGEGVGNSTLLVTAKAGFDATKSVGYTFESASNTRTTAQSTPRIYSYEITTTSESEYLVLGTTYDFVIIKGVYNAGMLALTTKATSKVLNQLEARTLITENIVTPMFGAKQNKNIFGGYIYGFQPSNVAVNKASLGQEVAMGYGSTSSTKETATNGAVLGIANVVAGNTYTISKEFSDYFAVFLVPTGLGIQNNAIGKLIHFDSGVRSVTFTVPAGYDRVFMYLSIRYQYPKVQVELGSKATGYQPLGAVFANTESQNAPLSVDVITQDNTYIDLKSNSNYFVRSTGLGGAFDVTPEELLAKYYDGLVTDFPEYVTKKVLGKDATGTYDIHEFVFEPDNWEQKIVITSGMHPTERIPPVALGILLNEIYRNPEKHTGLAYLRNKVKIVVIPIINTWGHNQTTRKAPEHYLNSNSVNISRNFAERWDVLDRQSVYDNKGVSPFSEAEAAIMRDLYIREKNNLAFTIDTHTGESWDADTLIYWLQDDPFLRPSLENTVSMKSDAIRSIKGNTTPLIVTAHETQRALNLYWLWSVLGIPSATVEYGTRSTASYDSEQAQHYVNQLFNYIHYALKERLYDKRMQAVKNEHNKPFVSLYSTLTAHNEVLNYKWTAAQLNTNLYDKLGMVKSTVNGSTVYTHTPSYYDKTVLLVSGAVSTEKKGITVLAFACHKLMTDNNPNLVGFKNNVRFIVAPLATDATVTAILAANTVDLVMEVSGTDTDTNPVGYAKYQVLHKNGSFTGFGASIAKVANKYGATINANVAKTDGGLVLSSLATAVNIPYQAHYFSKNLLPAKVVPEETRFVDYGYTAKEMSCCAELLFNSLANYVK